MATEAEASTGVEASAEASGEFSLEAAGEAGFSSAVTLATEAIDESDIGKQAASYAQAAATGASIGASLGTACGPAAPICSTVGAVVGALIALGAEIAKAFEKTIKTEPCKVFDYGFVTRRCPVAGRLTGGGGPGSWVVGPYGVEKMLWNTRSPDFPPGVTVGFVFWALRRIREDGLGAIYYNKLAQIMHIPVKMPKVTATQAREYAKTLEKSPLGRAIPKNAPNRAKLMVQLAAIRMGASIPEAVTLTGDKPSPGQIMRYERTRKLLDAEFKKRGNLEPEEASNALTPYVNAFKALPGGAKFGLGAALALLVYRLTGRR